MMAALLLALIIPLVVLEAGLRLAGPKRVHGIVSPHPVLHHAHQPGSRVRMKSITSEFGGFEMCFDQDGCRIDPKRAVAHDREPFRVALLGDSFVEAAQLSHERSFAGQLEGRLRALAWTRNYGVSSYSPLLEQLQWRTQISQWHPTHVVLMLYWNDVDPAGEVSDSDYLAKALKNDDGEIVAVPGKGSPLASLLNRFHLKWEVTRAWKAAKYQMALRRGETAAQSDGKFIEPNPDLAQPTTGILLQLKKEVESAGARFFLTAVPSKGRLHGRVVESGPEFSDKVKNWAAANRIDFIDLAAAFRAEAAKGRRLFFEEDIHFNEAGHEVAAEVIGRALEGQMSETRVASRHP